MPSDTKARYTQCTLVTDTTHLGNKLRFTKRYQSVIGESTTVRKLCRLVHRGVQSTAKLGYRWNNLLNLPGFPRVQATQTDKHVLQIQTRDDDWVFAPNYTHRDVLKLLDHDLRQTHCNRTITVSNCTPAISLSCVAIRIVARAWLYYLSTSSTTLFHPRLPETDCSTIRGSMESRNLESGRKTPIHPQSINYVKLALQVPTC